MSERKYEHTVDMEQLVATAARYERVINDGQRAANEGDDHSALDSAIDALEITQGMFYSLLPADLREEFWDGLDAALKETADA